ncbi:unnamed protein product [Adineta steineri]|uniref:G-protein coupled receptors family 1 profile domain-containing protein n=1 Tax=Adineta steineri TaxID=433720 RepID=A0A814GYY4_9BILA|nr:unnamed protein product [Adineta steineri]CAF4020219.1 unnamed protein product [Adineta steineri]
MNTTNNSVISGPPAHPFMSNYPVVVLLYRYGLGFIFLFGFTGNLASMATFMQTTLRATSTAFLFRILAFSDSLFLLVSIFDFIEVGLTQGPILLTNYDNLCRFRWFMKGFTQFCSAWILVFVTIDRWLRTCFPFKANKWCTHRNVIIVTICIIIIGTGLHSHMLSAQLFGKFFPGVATAACGPIKYWIPYAHFFFVQWPFIQVFFICLIPVTLMLLGSIDIHRTIQKTKSRIQTVAMNQPQQLRQARLHRQMLILMIYSIMIFVVTTLPVSIHQIVAAFEFLANTAIDENRIVNDTAILTVLLSLNYAINFYVHCLTSKLFRDEFIKFIKIMYRLAGGTTGNNIININQNVLQPTVNGNPHANIRHQQPRT